MRVDDDSQENAFEKDTQQPQVGVLRNRHRSRLSRGRRKAYYALGLISFGTALLILGYQIMNAKMGSQTAERSITSTRHYAESSRSLTRNKKKEAEDNARADQKKFREKLKNLDKNDLLSSAFNEVRNLNLARRIEFWSKYLEQNLEGRERLALSVANFKVEDTAPLVPDAYDCTTFVETVASLARSQNPEQFARNLLSIRYRNGSPGFTKRNHFPEGDWIPNNQRAGILKDITFEVASRGGVVAQLETKRIEKAKWLEARYQKEAPSRKLVSLESAQEVTPVDAQVSYISISDLKEVIDKIPSGTVLNLVHRDHGAHPVLITHQGFVVRDGKSILLRHASIGGLIRTNDLYRYLTGLKKKEKNQDWPLIGVNLDQIMDSTSETNFRNDSR